MKFRLTSEYGELSPVRNWQPHNGIDFAMPEGTVLRSIGKGVVDKVFDGSDAIGKGCSVQFADGTRIIYGHMKEVKVKVGETVNEGAKLGLSGNTGHSTAAHLHFGMREADGAWIDPTPLAKKVDAYSGDQFSEGIITKMLGGVGDTVRQKAEDMTIEIAFGILDALKELLMGATLIGSGVLFILGVAGWKEGKAWSGVLIVANILLRVLTGGF